MDCWCRDLQFAAKSRPISGKQTHGYRAAFLRELNSAVASQFKGHENSCRQLRLRETTSIPPSSPAGIARPSSRVRVMDRLESARFHDILVLGVLFVAGFVVSILSCIYSKNRKGAKPLLAPHPGKRSVATSCGRSATRSSSTRPRSLNGHGLLRSKGSPSQPAVQRGPPPDCGTSVSVSRSPGASRARDMSQQRRPEGAAPSQEAMDLRNGPAVQKLLERFEDLSARLRQHIKQHENEPTSNRVRGTRSSSDAGSRRLCRETPAATRRRFDLLCREVQANRARLQALNGGSGRGGMDCKRGSGYAEIPDYANASPSVQEVGTLSGANPGAGGVAGELGGILCSEGRVGNTRDYPTREADLEALRRNRKFLADCNSTLDQIMKGWRASASQSSGGPQRRPSSPRNASKSASTPSAKAQRPCRSTCARTRGGAAASGSAMRGNGARNKRRSSTDAGSSSSRMVSARPAYAVTSGTVRSCRHGRDVSPTMATCPLETATCALPECVYLPGPPSTVTPTLPPPPGVSQSPSKNPSRAVEFFPGAYQAMLPPKAGEGSSKPVASSGGDRGDRCFPPPVPLPRPDGNVLQEARAYAPAQHLAVLRALLNDGVEGTEDDDEAGIQDEVVGCSDDSEWEDEGVGGGSASQGGLVEREDEDRLGNLGVGQKQAADHFCA